MTKQAFTAFGLGMTLFALSASQVAAQTASRFPVWLTATSCAASTSGSTTA